MYNRGHICTNCGKSFKSRQYAAFFCSTPCRAEFNVRRRNRGAELYDAMMEAAYGKEENKKQAKQLVDALMRAYRDGDNHKRDGRRSWQSFTYASVRIPMAYGKEGDKR